MCSTAIPYGWSVPVLTALLPIQFLANVHGKAAGDSSSLGGCTHTGERLWSGYCSHLGEWTKGEKISLFLPFYRSAFQINKSFKKKKSFCIKWSLLLQSWKKEQKMKSNKQTNKTIYSLNAFSNTCHGSSRRGWSHSMNGRGRDTEFVIFEGVREYFCSSEFQFRSWNNFS